jgi:hypothetical protein
MVNMARIVPDHHAAPPLPLDPFRLSLKTDTAESAGSAAAGSAAVGESDPAPSPPSLSAPPGEPRDDRPPTITAGPHAIEHRKIGTTSDRSGRPTKSGVTVAAQSPSGIDSVELELTVRGQTVSVPMVRAGDKWIGQVGPFADHLAGADVDVAVEAVGRNGHAVRRDVGRIEIAECFTED